jgi:hypothetical protein
LAAGAIGTAAAYFDIFIIAGVDALTIGTATLLLLRIFSSEGGTIRAAGAEPPPRSLQNSDAHELKISLVQHLSQEGPVFIGFPPDDREAQDFAQQIATFLDEHGFSIAGFAAELPAVTFAPGVGLDGNRVMVGPVRAAAAWSSTPLSPRT